jgi:hypothetical protein
MSFKERVLGDRIVSLRSIAIRQERFKTFPSMGSVNLSPLKLKLKQDARHNLSV